MILRTWRESDSRLPKAMSLPAKIGLVAVLLLSLLLLLLLIPGAT
jgi:hypothetical protein